MRADARGGPRRSADLLERRWLLSVLYAAHAGALRFNEFKQILGSVPPRTLAQRLSELEEAGLLDRTVIDARPPRVEYRLTDRGPRVRRGRRALSRWPRRVRVACPGSDPGHGRRCAPGTLTSLEAPVHTRRAFESVAAQSAQGDRGIDQGGDHAARPGRPRLSRRSARRRHVPRARCSRREQTRPTHEPFVNVGGTLPAGRRLRRFPDHDHD